VQGRGLVIYDCDGVLVDSEPIAIGVLLAMLGELGVPADAAFAYGRCLGRGWPTVVEVIAETYGLRLTETQADEMRRRLIARFRADLEPMPGVERALARIGAPACVASSSLPERLAASLETTGLLPRFAPHVFSAAEVRRGKPAPDLFLHAAARMGADPADCVVVEDSPTGIAAAKAAGMRVIAFLGGGHVEPGGLGPVVAALAPDATCRHMDGLPAAVARFLPGRAGAGPGARPGQ
jgi:HAD superfamily hydrolase (TIGR01509 family)